MSVSLSGIRTWDKCSAAIAIQNGRGQPVTDFAADGKRLWAPVLMIDPGKVKDNHAFQNAHPFQDKRGRRPVFTAPTKRFSCHATPDILNLLLPAIAQEDWSGNVLIWKGGIRKYLSLGYRDNEQGGSFGQVYHLQDGFLNTLELTWDRSAGLPELEVSGLATFEQGPRSNISGSPIVIPQAPAAGDMALTFPRIEIYRDPAGANVRLTVELFRLRVQHPFFVYPYTKPPKIIKGPGGKGTEVIGQLEGLLWSNETKDIQEDAESLNLKDWRVIFKDASGTKMLQIDLKAVDWESSDVGWENREMRRFSGTFRAHYSGGIEPARFTRTF